MQQGVQIDISKVLRQAPDKLVPEDEGRVLTKVVVAVINQLIGGPRPQWLLGLQPLKKSKKD